LAKLTWQTYRRSSCIRRPSLPTGAATGGDSQPYRSRTGTVLPTGRFIAFQSIWCISANHFAWPPMCWLGLRILGRGFEPRPPHRKPVLPRLILDISPSMRKLSVAEEKQCNWGTYTKSIEKRHRRSAADPSELAYALATRVTNW
jgi:hypothetical protein